MGLRSRKQPITGIKPKDLVGIPWRVAFALQDDGWYLRSDIIWAKPNPMPESVTDRPTKSHEYIFLLTKNARYYYDAESIREDFADDRRGNSGTTSWRYSDGSGRNGDAGLGKPLDQTGRNKRSVWTIATAPFSEAHFATFPPEIPEICIKAGTSQHGCCGKCGAPWERQTEYGGVVSTGGSDKGLRAQNLGAVSPRGDTKPSSSYVTGNMTQREKITTGWEPSCSCDAAVVPCTVLDIFSGAGTTCLVADRLQRNGIGIELNPQYAAMADSRISRDRGGLLDLMEATA